MKERTPYGKMEGTVAKLSQDGREASNSINIRNRREKSVMNARNKNVKGLVAKALKSFEMMPKSRGPCQQG